eukprot:7650121-Pyramimonas_sp.AAC.1
MPWPNDAVVLGAFALRTASQLTRKPKTPNYLSRCRLLLMGPPLLLGAEVGGSLAAVVAVADTVVADTAAAPIKLSRLLGNFLSGDSVLVAVSTSPSMASLLRGMPSSGVAVLFVASSLSPTMSQMRTEISDTWGSCKLSGRSNVRSCNSE